MPSTQNYTDGVLRQEWNDDTLTYTAWDENGQITEQRPYTPEEEELASVSLALANQDANEQKILAKASAAIEDNRAFLALESPTSPQALVQVQNLTRQVTGLLKLKVRDLDQEG